METTMFNYDDQKMKMCLSALRLTWTYFSGLHYQSRKPKTLEDENLTWLLISMVCRLFIFWDFYMSIIETKHKGYCINYLVCSSKWINPTLKLEKRGSLWTPHPPATLKFYSSVILFLSKADIESNQKFSS